MRKRYQLVELNSKLVPRYGTGPSVGPHPLHGGLPSCLITGRVCAWLHLASRMIKSQARVHGHPGRVGQYHQDALCLCELHGLSGCIEGKRT